MQREHFAHEYYLDLDRNPVLHQRAFFPYVGLDVPDRNRRDGCESQK